MKMRTLCFLLLFCVQVIAQEKKYDIIVAQDGSGNFTTIQEAVNSVRDFAQVPARIFIKNGVYHEKLVIPTWKTMITLIGENKDSTIITNADYSGKAYPGKDPTGKDKYNTFTSYTVLVTGDDFTADNITIENAAGPVGQAVALHVEGDRCTVRNCRLLGNQDTLYAGREGSRQYYKGCYITGTTDFIFGASTVVFDSCTINSKKNSYVTAASTTNHQEYGFVFLHCTLTADTGVNKVFLGRPWRPYAAVIFAECSLGAHILPQGWHNWNQVNNEQTARYAEYGNTGVAAITTARVPWSHQLSAKQAKQLTLTNIFKDWRPL
ncbi:pectin esterase [Chitinophaga agrisoli]|uniref:Pectinesterase n=1 Tax=Chitinophaga agrisoli TaxID=2607653 RepID=A0A5B2VRV1_9BACT|nr:pectinesterase family protein [Chitinophaga agrisoli]KAA2241745.1 pectin esterase [Chitinophaga agrisoli]